LSVELEWKSYWNGWAERLHNSKWNFLQGWENRLRNEIGSFWEPSQVQKNTWFTQNYMHRLAEPKLPPGAN